MKKAAFLFFRVEVRNAACAVQYLVVVQTMLVRCPKNLDFTVFQKVSLSNLIFRKTSLDELPQIFNVLKGEMSLVGPRPIIKDEMVRYGEYINDYLMVKPGITGMWQVSGRSDADYKQRVQLDSWYVRNWSVWLDLMLLWRTMKIVAQCKGAY